MRSPNRASLLTQAGSNYPYLGYLREQLELTKVKVHKWLPWDDETVYEAFIEKRRVILPIPTCQWSFMVGLHEIGHVSTGERQYTYLQEYNAEKWAIARAKQHYGIVYPEYEKDARRQVWLHIVQNHLYYDLSLEKIKPYVLDWIGATVDQVALDAKVYHDLQGVNSLILK